MKFLVTGSAGLVGSQVVKDLVQQNHTVYSCYNKTKPLDGIMTPLDLSDKNQIIQTLEKIQPDRIIHLAAMTGVDLCETEQELAITINTKSTEIIAKQAAKRKSAYARAEEMKVNAMMEDEGERRQEWIDYYVAQGDTAKAIELGWQPPAEVPQWQQHQMQQEEAQQASVPTMFSLDDI